MVHKESAYSFVVFFFLLEESVFTVPGIKLWAEENKFPNSMLKVGHDFRQKKVVN